MKSLLARLTVQKSFRVTNDENDVIVEMATDEARKEADVIRRLFRRGLEHELAAERRRKKRR